MAGVSSRISSRVTLIVTLLPGSVTLFGVTVMLSVTLFGCFVTRRLALVAHSLFIHRPNVKLTLGLPQALHVSRFTYALGKHSFARSCWCSLYWCFARSRDDVGGVWFQEESYVFGAAECVAIWGGAEGDLPFGRILAVYVGGVDITASHSMSVIWGRIVSERWAIRLTVTDGPG